MLWQHSAIAFTVIVSSAEEAGCSIPRQLTLLLRRIFTGALDVYQSLRGLGMQLGKADSAVSGEIMRHAIVRDKGASAAS